MEKRDPQNWRPAAQELAFNVRSKAAISHLPIELDGRIEPFRVRVVRAGGGDQPPTTQFFVAFPPSEWDLQYFTARTRKYKASARSLRSENPVFKDPRFLRKSNLATSDEAFKEHFIVRARAGHQAAVIQLLTPKRRIALLDGKEQVPDLRFEAGTRRHWTFTGYRPSVQWRRGTRFRGIVLGHIEGQQVVEKVDALIDTALMLVAPE